MSKDFVATALFERFEAAMTLYIRHGSPSKIETSHDHILRVFKHEYDVLLTNRFNRSSDSAVTIVIIGTF